MALNTEEFEDKAQDLTGRVEKNQSISDELNAMPFQERLQLAQRMDAINEEHRQANAKLPDIELVVKAGSGGQQHLMDMTARTAGKIWDSTTDVYDMPKGVEHNLMDYVVNTQTTRDLLDSRRRFDVTEVTEKLDY